MSSAQLGKYCCVTCTYVSNLVEFGLKYAKNFYWKYVKHICGYYRLNVVLITCA